MNHIRALFGGAPYRFGVAPIGNQLMVSAQKHLRHGFFVPDLWSCVLGILKELGKMALVLESDVLGDAAVTKPCDAICEHQRTELASGYYVVPY